jgi:hypothetical protein
LDIGDIIDDGTDIQVGDDFFEGDTEDERNEWTKRGGNFGPAYGGNYSGQQHVGDRQKKESRNNVGGGSPSSSTYTLYDIIDLYDSDTECITKSIAEYCTRYSANNTDIITAIIHALSGMSFENHASVDSSERLIRNLCKTETTKRDGTDLETIIKHLHGVYAEGHKGEPVQREHVLLKILTDIPNPGSNGKAASEVLSKIKDVFRKRSDDVLMQLPPHVRGGLSTIAHHELETNIAEVLSTGLSPTLAVADLSHKKIRYATIYLKKPKNRDLESPETKPDYTEEPEYNIAYNDVVINAIPIRIIKYQNPIAPDRTSTSGIMTPKYDVTFESPLGNYTSTSGPSTIEEILSLLKSCGHVYNPWQGERVLCSVFEHTSPYVFIFIPLLIQLYGCSIEHLST